jgi:hypothetical protein
VIYSPAAEYIGDELDVCVTVMGMSGGIPCTTKICSTIVLPPKHKPCAGGLRQAPFFHSLGKTAGSNSKHTVDLEARSHIFAPVYEHIWTVRDNISGRESVVYGEAPELIDGTEFDRVNRRIDLQVCHIIRNKIKDCIVGGECQDVSYECTQVSWLRINSVTYDPVLEQFIIDYKITQAESDHDADIYVDNELVTQVDDDTPMPSYTVTVPAPGPCGTALIHMKVTFRLATGGISLCSYLSTKITYGPQPCIQTTPGLYPTVKKAKRTGVEASGYGLKLAPNPTADNFSVLWFDVEEAERIGFELYNVLGEKVRHFASEAQAGSNKARLDLQGLPAGVYLLHANGKRKQSIKLVIDK